MPLDCICPTLLAKLVYENKRKASLSYKKVAEMSGLSEINMHQDALELAKQILAEEQLDAIAFNAALSVILVGAPTSNI